MKIIQGRKVLDLEHGDLLERISAYGEVHVDLGTGDGAFVYRLARSRPLAFCIGIDANRDLVREYSAKVGRKPQRGGSPNALYVLASAEDLPHELDGIADRIYINFPWGSLLRALVEPDERLLTALARISRPPARLDSLLNYSVFGDAGLAARMDLPCLSMDYIDRVLAPGYARAGILIEERRLLGDGELPFRTTWGGRLVRASRRETLYMSAVIRPGESAGTGRPGKAKGIGKVKGIYTFHCRGHKNIRARHTKTIEFTRETDITPRGDCIIGVSADFDVGLLRALSGKIRLTVAVGDLTDTFHAVINPDFVDPEEMVLRRSRYNTPRTFGFLLNKGAVGLKRDIVAAMKNRDAVMRVTLEEK